MSFHVAPLFVLYCHCTDGAGKPVAVADQLTTLPAVTMRLAGLVTTAGAEGCGGGTTVSVAASDAVDPSLLVNTARNCD